MSENFRDNQENFQVFVLSQALLKVPISEAFENACRVTKNKKLNYTVFEYMYMKFAGGHRTLDVNLSCNLQYRGIQDLPQEAFNRVMAYTDMKCKMKLRKTSHKLKKKVDKSDYHYERVKVFVRRDWISIRLDYDCILYSSKGKGCEVSWFYDRKRRFLKRANFVAVAITDLSIALSNADSLKLVFAKDNEHINRKMLSALQQIHKSRAAKASGFKVKQLTFKYGDGDDLLRVVKCIEPEILVEIHFDTQDDSYSYLAELINMPHWNFLKKFEPHAGDLPPEIVDYVGHMEDFSFNCTPSLQGLAQLIQTLIQSRVFEKCRMSFLDPPNFSLAQLARKIGKKVGNKKIVDLIHIFHFPHLNKCFKLFVNLNEFTLTNVSDDDIIVLN